MFSSTIRKSILSFFVVLTGLSLLFGKAGSPINQDESKISPFELPDIYVSPITKTRADNALQWLDKVRPDVSKIFEEQIYGKRPPRPQLVKSEIVESSDDALGGIAKRRQVKITVGDANGMHTFTMLAYFPKKAKKPVPTFLCLNFSGNHVASTEQEVIVPDCWVRNTTRYGMNITNNKTTAKDRGANPFDFKEIIARGYGVATIFYCEIYGDEAGEIHRKNSIYKIFKNPEQFGGAIAAWSWGLSRGLDALETLPECDSKKVIVVGHSRLGKTSLLAGAYDKRFAMVISNNSGCMGAAISRRKFGEHVEFITRVFPHWFLPKLRDYADKEEQMPIDQHQLLAMIAPRPLYVTSATEDLWADPRGELLAVVEASKVYALFGGKDFPTMEDFKAEEPFQGEVGYHLRKGKHALKLYDWMRFCDFADKHFK